MSLKPNLKQRLQKALNQISIHEDPSQFAHESIGRDSIINTSPKNTEYYSSSLNDRVTRLQQKIEVITESIEQGKNSQIYEYENKVLSLENKFDGIIDQTEKRFDVMLNEQLNLIEQYLNRDRLGKQEQLRLKKQNIAERQRELR